MTQGNISLIELQFTCLVWINTILNWNFTVSTTVSCFYSKGLLVSSVSSAVNTLVLGCIPASSCVNSAYNVGSLEVMLVHYSLCWIAFNHSTPNYCVRYLFNRICSSKGCAKSSPPLHPFIEYSFLHWVR